MISLQGIMQPGVWIEEDKRPPCYLWHCCSLANIFTTERRWQSPEVPAAEAVHRPLSAATCCLRPALSQLLPHQDHLCFCWKLLFYVEEKKKLLFRSAKRKADKILEQSQTKQDGRELTRWFYSRYTCMTFNGLFFWSLPSWYWPKNEVSNFDFIFEFARTFNVLIIPPWLSWRGSHSVLTGSMQC